MLMLKCASFDESPTPCNRDSNHTWPVNTNANAKFQIETKKQKTKIKSITEKCIISSSTYPKQYVMHAKHTGQHEAQEFHCGAYPGKRNKTKQPQKSIINTFSVAFPRISRISMWLVCTIHSQMTRNQIYQCSL